MIGPLCRVQCRHTVMVKSPITLLSLRSRSFWRVSSWKCVATTVRGQYDFLLSKCETVAASSATPSVDCVPARVRAHTSLSISNSQTTQKAESRFRIKPVHNQKSRVTPRLSHSAPGASTRPPTTSENASHIITDVI
jgi:hypothetical protein